MRLLVDEFFLLFTGNRSSFHSLFWVAWKTAISKMAFAFFIELNSRENVGKTKTSSCVQQLHIEFKKFFTSARCFIIQFKFFHFVNFIEHHSQNNLNFWYFFFWLSSHIWHWYVHLRAQISYKKEDDPCGISKFSMQEVSKSFKFNRFN